ncbi:hypothetical protein HRbin22_02479 [Candidatus Thermoflexus japonica]|uniref:Uncharacterized protein n=1 Tax=Candidatus Thermoflexus japonica TaxID=2035417 RepID=A0A2H5Y9V3_9CHLR|nr:hypothetical protein HRbin22_02479 [Candidatus Thermoflexus japonica]
MIRDREAWRRWEARWQRGHPADPEENFRVFQTLLEMARAVGAWPPSNPLEGLEVDIALARKVNTYVQPPGSAGQGA